MATEAEAEASGPHGFISDVDALLVEAEASGLHGFISDVDALLAESEALLVSIDAAPVAPVVVPQSVAPPPVGGDTENDKCGDPKTEVAPPDAVIIKKKRSRNSTREREKAEIELLRVQATALEKEVTALRGEKTQVSQALAPVWRRLAERQLQGKRKAENENKYLRTEVEANALTLRRLRETLVARLKQQNSGRVLRNEQRRCMEWLDAVVFARLKAELTDAYAKTDDAIRESGICSMLEDGVEYSHSRKLRGEDGPQSYSNELVSIRVLPFEAHKASEAMWHTSSTQFFRCCFHSMHPCNQLSSCSGYLGEKQQKDIMAIKFQRKVRLDGVDVVFDTRQVMQRYKEDARHVHVWIAEYYRTGPTKLPATDTKNMGWVIWKSAPVSYSSASIVGSISLSKVANMAGQYEDPDHRTSNVTDSSIPSNKVCTDELSMMVENMLLQPQRNVDES